MYSILAVNPGHNGSAALVVDGELKYYCEEERLSRMKYDGNPFRAMLQILVNHPVDELVIGGADPKFALLPWTRENAYAALARKFNPNIKISEIAHLHHLGHAAAAFYGSGFETAAAVVVDGAGSFHTEQVGENGQTVAGFETESIYACAYPNTFQAVHKRYSDGINSPYHNNGIQEFDGSVTITKAYEAVSMYLGFGFIEAGKTMGLALYGGIDPNLPPFFVNDKGNKNLLNPLYPMGALIDENRFPYLQRNIEPSAWHADFDKCPTVAKNLAWQVQSETELQVAKLIQKALDVTGENNIVLSGGFALNCVANYKYLRYFPGVRFHIDPVAHDGGTAIGLAQYAWHTHTQDMTVRALKSLYMSAQPDYSQLAQAEKNTPELKVWDTTPNQVVDLLIEGRVVAIFQGASEAGPRALGNRSILFDPRRVDGKDIVNKVKHREWFRPFAGTVMEEYAADWFDMAGLPSSPHMMYAVNVKPENASELPAICHVDGTCRVQTVNPEQNPAFYNLISVFHARTRVPVLFNTSFNLAGQPLVESVIDALVCMFNSDIDHIYMPDIGKLVSKVPKAQ